MAHFAANVMLLIALGLPLSCCVLLLLTFSFLMRFLSSSLIFVSHTPRFGIM
jgi:hypothetical protein